MALATYKSVFQIDSIGSFVTFDGEKSVRLLEMANNRRLQDQKLRSSSASLSASPEVTETIKNKVREMLNEDFDEDFLMPEREVLVKVAVTLGKAVSFFGLKMRAPNFISADGEGGIRVEWILGNKELRLLFSTKTEKIYWQENKTYGLEGIDILLSRLNWLFS